MSGARQLGAEFLPWSGLAASFTGFAIVHQWGSDGVFDSCGNHGSVVNALILSLGLVIVAVGVLGSWRIIRHRGETPPRRFIAMISTGAAALFTLAMTLPTIASLLIPRCFG